MSHLLPGKQLTEFQLSTTERGSGSSKTPADISRSSREKDWMIKRWRCNLKGFIVTSQAPLQLTIIAVLWKEAHVPRVRWRRAITDIAVG